MKRFLCILLLTFLKQNIQAQLLPYEQLINDSLQLVLKEGKTDSIRARAAFHLSKIWINRDSAQGLNYLNQGKNLAKDNSYLSAIYRYQVIPSYSDDKEVNAILAILKSYDNKDSWNYQYRVSINRVRWLNNRGRAEEAMQLLKKNIIPLNTKLQDKSYTAEIALETGRAFLNQRMESEAAPYLEKAVAIYETLTPKDEPLLYNQIHTLGALANLYTTLKIDKKADSVIRRAKELLLVQPNFPQELRIIASEAMHLIQIKQYDKAATLLEKTLAKAQGVPKRYLLNLYFQQHKALAGLGYHQEALQLLKKSHPIDSIALNPKLYQNINMGELLRTYALAHEETRDFKQAAQYWKNYFTHRDSVGKDEIAGQISKLEVQLRTQEKDAAIQSLENERIETALRLKNQRILNGLFATLAILLVTLLGFFVYTYRSKQKANAIRVLQLQTDNNLEIAKALLDGEERERQRIGRDLHDSLGGALSGIHMQLSESTQQQTSGTLPRAINQLEESIRELRRISHNMVPESLLSNGLDTALQDLCVASAVNETSIEYQSTDLPSEIPSKIQTNIYRIVQELLTNALRHGKAKKIIVQCLENQGTILLTVEDDGLGFDTITTNLTAGIGLKNIKRRVDYMQGQFSIESQLNQGTIINIEIHVS